MIRNVEICICPDHIVHSPRAQPRRTVMPPAPPEQYEGLWARVSRICDEFMLQCGDVQLGSQIWGTPPENTQK
jgi:hypothetical protein